MNESVNGSIYTMLQGISNTLGVNETIISIIIAFGCMIAASLFIYLRTMSILLSMISMTITTLVLTLIGFIPIWILPVIIGIAGLMIYKHAYIDDNSIPESYRDRLIKAYEAKFGYIEPTFVEEIDTHIKAVENLAKGYTRAVHQDKLKRLEKFVEFKK
jgi:hypothetical protein